MTRGWLARVVAVVIVLPAALLVLVGLGALLHALGDRGGALACGRLVLVGGVVWVTSVVVMALATAAVVVDEGRPRRRRGHGRRRRRRRDGDGQRDVAPARE